MIFFLWVASSSGCGCWPLPAFAHADFFMTVYGPRLVMWSYMSLSILQINLSNQSVALCVLIARRKENIKM
jgi:hypothetical protein